jgi:hypothetical protein
MSSKLNIGSVIWNATTGVESGQIVHDGTYTAITVPNATDTLLIRQSGQQRQITRDNLLFPAETVLNLTQANFMLVTTNNYFLSLTSAQINANDAIFVRISAASNSANYYLTIPVNTKPIRIWFTRVPNATFTANALYMNAEKNSGELAKLVFSPETSLTASNLTDSAEFTLAATTLFGLVYENVNGKQKMITEVYQSEI